MMNPCARSWHCVRLSLCSLQPFLLAPVTGHGSMVEMTRSSASFWWWSSRSSWFRYQYGLAGVLRSETICIEQLWIPWIRNYLRRRCNIRRRRIGIYSLRPLLVGGFWLDTGIKEKELGMIYLRNFQFYPYIGNDVFVIKRKEEWHFCYKQKR